MSQWESVLRELPTLHFKETETTVYEDEVFSIELNLDIHGRTHVHFTMKREYDKDVHRHMKELLPVLMAELVQNGLYTLYTTVPISHEKERKWLTKFIGFVYDRNVKLLSTVDQNQILLRKELRR